MANSTYVKFDPGMLTQMSTQFFRYGETCDWGQVQFAPGQAIDKWTWWRAEVDMHAEVTSICWEVFADNEEDLRELLWLGALSWNFVQTSIPIAPLSHYVPGAIHRQVRVPTKDEPPAVQLVEEARENEWRDLITTVRFGRSLFFQGSFRYENIGIALPARARAAIECTFAKPFVPKKEVRLRVILNLKYRYPVEIG
jgi:hypothetical protein